MWLDGLIALSKRIRRYTLKVCFDCREDKSVSALYTLIQMAAPGICHRWETQCHLHPKIVGLESGEGSPFEALNLFQTPSVAPVGISMALQAQPSRGGGEAFLS